MLTIRNYVRAQTLDEAYELAQKKRNVVLGGMLWLKMKHKTVPTAIDLCDLGLDAITEDEAAYHIGAMATLRDIETHPGLNALTQGAMRDAVKHIVGVQFRNLATVGGSLYGRFGFSDVLTLFQVLPARVRLHHLGELSVAEFARLPRSTRDILTEVILPKTPMAVRYLSQRNSATDFPVVACAVSRVEGRYTCAVGARPGPAVPFRDESGILSGGVTPASAAAFGEDVARRAVFGSNMRGSAEYRRRVCGVLIRRALLAMEEESSCASN